MAISVNVPVNLLSDRKTATLSPAAIRLYVTGWAICDDKGTISNEKIDLATARWGDEMHGKERLELSEILADLERLGFLRDVKKKRDVFQFKRSGAWMS